MILIFSKNLQNQKNQSKKKKVLTLKNTIILLKRRQKVLNAFESGIFPKGKQGNGVWQMLKKLPVALAQAKVDNTSEKSDKLYILCIEQKKLLKKYILI